MVFRSQIFLFVFLTLALLLTAADCTQGLFVALTGGAGW